MTTYTKSSVIALGISSRRHIGRSGSACGSPLAPPSRTAGSHAARPVQGSARYVKLRLDPINYRFIREERRKAWIRV